MPLSRRTRHARTRHGVSCRCRSRHARRDGVTSCADVAFALHASARSPDAAASARDRSTARMPDRAPGRRRAVPLPLRHGEVHRLQVLRRRLQRAERQPGGDQLAARRRDRRRLVSERHALVPLDGLQPLPRADLPEGCPVDAYTKDPVTGIVRHSADACIGCQVLHLELLVRRAAVQPRARRGRQVRHVPRPAGARAGAGVRQRVSRGRDRDRDRQRRRLARVGRGRQPPRPGCRPTTAACRRRASRCRPTCRRTRSRATSPTSRPSTRTGRWW